MTFMLKGAETFEAGEDVRSSSFLEKLRSIARLVTPLQNFEVDGAETFEMSPTGITLGIRPGGGGSGKGTRVELTAYDDTTQTYTGSVLEPDDMGGEQLKTPAEVITGIFEHNNHIGIELGAKVTICKNGKYTPAMDEEDAWHFTFVLPRETFFVMVAANPPTSGPAWTYTVTSPDGHVLGDSATTPVSPEANRNVGVSASGPAEVGTGYYDEEGDFHLLWVDEFYNIPDMFLATITADNGLGSYEFLQLSNPLGSPITGTATEVHLRQGIKIGSTILVIRSGLLWFFIDDSAIIGTPDPDIKVGAGEHPLEADTDDWDRKAQASMWHGVTFTVLTGMRLDKTNPFEPHWYFYTRNITTDADGHIDAIDAEQRVEIPLETANLVTQVLDDLVTADPSEFKYQFRSVFGFGFGPDTPGNQVTWHTATEVEPVTSIEWDNATKSFRLQRTPYHVIRSKVENPVPENWHTVAPFNVVTNIGINQGTNELTLTTTPIYTLANDVANSPVGWMTYSIATPVNQIAVVGTDFQLTRQEIGVLEIQGPGATETWHSGTECTGS